MCYAAVTVPACVSLQCDISCAVLAGRLNQAKQQFSPCSEERDLEQYGSTKNESNIKNLRKTMQLLFLFLPLIFQASGVYEIESDTGTGSAGAGDKHTCFRWRVLWLSKVTHLIPGAARACPSLSSSIRQKQIVLCLLSSPSWHPHVPEHCPCCPSAQPCANELISTRWHPWETAMYPGRVCRQSSCKVASPEE